MKKKVVFKRIFVFLVLLFIVVGSLFWAKGSIASSNDDNASFSVRTYFLRAGETLKDFFYSLFYHIQINKENKTLTEENYQLKLSLNNCLETQKENELLREALGLKKDKAKDSFLADIIGRSFLNFSSEFVINKGQKDGLMVGKPVVGVGQFLVGEVKQVDDNSALVRAINDNDFRASIFVGAGEVEAVFRGNGLKQPTLEMLPITSDVSVGDAVFTSGLDQKFARGFILGKIKKVKKVDGQAFQEAEIDLAFDWNRISQVLVIK